MKYILQINWLGKSRYIRGDAKHRMANIFTLNENQARMFNTEQEGVEFTKIFKQNVLELKNEVIKLLNGTTPFQSLLYKCRKYDKLYNTPIIVLPIKTISFSFNTHRLGGLKVNKVTLESVENKPRLCSFCGLIIPHAFKYLQLGKNGSMNMCGFCVCKFSEFFDKDELSKYKNEYNAAKFTEQL